MKTKIRAAVSRLFSTYWFLPSLMALLAVGFSLLTVRVDQALEGRITGLFLLYGGGPEGARVLLSTVAGSMITVAGVTFSITMVALSFASTQLGPRLLENFLRDRGNQVVLGTFVSTFLYCLLVLLTIRSTDSKPFVPEISVTFGIALALMSIGVLIYFFHHVSSSMHAEEIVAAVGQKLDRAVDKLLPGRPGYGMFEPEPRDEQDIPEELDEKAPGVGDTRSGYLQSIDYESLFSLAREHDLLLRINYRLGDFIPPEKDIVAVWPAKRLDDKVYEQINRATVIGVYPSWNQDVTYAVNQLVAIAVRALSPSINDPFLAMSCIDRLGAALIRLAQKSIPPSYRYDRTGRLRLITSSFRFEGVLDKAFDQIRQESAANVAVTIRLLETLATIAGVVERPERKEAIRRQAEMIKRAGDRFITEKLDQKDIAQRYRSLKKTLEAG
jgi:uncharacterized membrane protein